MSYLLRPLVLTWRYWPQLAACYLVGVLARRGAIQAAAWTGHNYPLWAAIIMPFAGLATLGSYVAMFLVVRRGIPVLAALPRPSLRGADVFTTVIVPFFAIYLGWQLFKEDWLAYQGRALNYRMGELHAVDPNALPMSNGIWIVIGAALITRYLLSYFASRLPRWLTAVRVYVDGLWVFLVLSYSVSAGFTFLVNPAGWVAKRRMVVWFNSTRAELFSYFKPLQLMWNGLRWVVSTVFGGAAVPLMWLAVVGIVYGVSTQVDWRAAARRTVGERGTAFLDSRVPKEGLQRGWRRVPSPLQSKVSDYALSKTGRFRPIVDSARLILHGGPAALAAYVLAYLVLAWLDMSGSYYGTQRGDGYLVRSMAWLLGPHGQLFWSAVSPTLSLISQLIVEPLRIALIVTAFAYCWQHVAAARTDEYDPSQHDPQQDGLVGGGDVDGSGRDTTGHQEAELQGTGLTAVGGSTGDERGSEAGKTLHPPTPPSIGDDAGAFRHGRGTGAINGDDG